VYGLKMCSRCLLGLLSFRLQRDRCSNGDNIAFTGLPSTSTSALFKYVAYPFLSVRCRNHMAANPLGLDFRPTKCVHMCDLATASDNVVLIIRAISRLGLSYCSRCVHRVYGTARETGRRPVLPYSWLPVTLLYPVSIFNNIFPNSK
jgi:hypothetical protein